ncbi:arginine metabolism regulation protein II [Aspergillus melleus]|uniref:Arginine metabolism regulation protein II n=1 Tax=Aspergillus melleus TaxID=138277 RepID=A0ACC3B044_9EURO|nr:arginine metabolism regulation protein II [Aspergillus melleus]
MVGGGRAETQCLLKQRQVTPTLWVSPVLRQATPTPAVLSFSTSFSRPSHLYSTSTGAAFHLHLSDAFFLQVVVSHSIPTDGFPADACTLKPLRSTLHLDQIDDILHYLDSLESVINHGSEDVSASIQNFGFFSLATAPCPSLADNSGCAAPSLPKALSPADDYDLFLDPGSTLISSEPCGDNPEIEAAWNLCTLHDEYELPLDFPPRQNLAALDMPPTIIPVKLRKVY